MSHDPMAPEGPAPVWRQRGGFSLFFDVADDGTHGEVWRSRLYHDESGAEAIEAGPDEEGWARWILARLAGDGSTGDRLPEAPRRSATVVLEVAGLRRTGGPDPGGVAETVIVETEIRVRGREALARLVIGSLVELLLDGPVTGSVPTGNGSP